MDTLNIDDEIASLSRQIEQEKDAIEAEERKVRDIYKNAHITLPGDAPLLSSSRKKLRLLEKKLKDLELVRDEPDWVVVFPQEQNDHDEIWKEKSPGLDFGNANRLPESRVLELLFADGDPSISSLSKLAFQLHTLWRLHQTPSMPFENQKQKGVYLQTTIENYGTILERYAKGPRMGLDFESIHSFLSEGKVYLQGTNELPRTGRLSIHIHSVKGIDISSGEISIQSDPRWDRSWTNRLKCRISHIGQPEKDEAFFYYGLVNAYSMVELMVLNTKDKAEDSPIIGALFIRVLDIMNYTHQDPDGIDAWFDIAPTGKVHLTIKFVETPGEQMPEHKLPWWLPKPQRHLPQLLKNPYPDAGHNFIVKLFDFQTQCALCATLSCAFSLAAQCTTCKILCHTRCLEDHRFAWIPSCLNTPPPSMKGQLSTEVSKAHQWIPFLNLSANWCSHCGLPLSLGPGNQEGANRQCVECAKTCHAQCQLLVPSRCGSSHPLPSRVIHLINSTCQFPVMRRPTTAKRPMPAQDPSTKPKVRRRRLGSPDSQFGPE